MSKQTEDVAHAELVSGSETSKHSHAGGGGGANVKSGLETNCQKNQGRSVTFNTPFSSVPYVVTCCAKNTQTSKPTKVYNVTINGFTLEPDEGDDFYWIATDAGNN